MDPITIDVDALKLIPRQRAVETSIFLHDIEYDSIVKRIISDAVQMKATDIRFEPTKGNLSIRIRLNGKFYELCRPPLEYSRRLISRMKVMADLDIAEERRPQHGRIRVQTGNRFIDLRLTTLPGQFGEEAMLTLER